MFSSAPTKTWRCGHYVFFKLWYCGYSDLLQKGEQTAGSDNFLSKWIKINLGLSFSTQRIQRGEKKAVQKPTVFSLLLIFSCILFGEGYI